MAATMVDQDCSVAKSVLINNNSAMEFEGKEFLGKWKTYKSDNFDSFLKSMEVPYFVRKTLAFVQPLIEITYDEETGYFTYRTEVFASYEIKFRFGEEFDEKAQGPGGEMFRSIITYKDGKMIHKQLKKDPCEYVREIKGDEMIQECKHKDVICMRYAKKV
ncbi:Fatty acid-binding -like protein 7 [Halotydeus destructor]|nr:Fatty acid-binding -like protein 7 [Halotydeus destructor]